MAVELPLKTKYTQVTHGKIRTRAAGGGNSTKKHANKRVQGAGLRIEGELKKTAQAQTQANRRVLIIDRGRKLWLPLDLYEGLVKGQAFDAYLSVLREDHA